MDENDEKQKAIIVDLDGTLSSTGWRKHFIEKKPKDWKSFFKNIPFDSPIEDTMNSILDFQSKGVEIVYVSARPEREREKSLAWLKEHKAPEGKLLLRKSNDFRPDYVVKEEILLQELNGYNIILALDDKQAVLAMYQKHNIPVQKVIDPNISAQKQGYFKEE